jgi:glycosyltransferase involved in cell wall biosynthesis
LLALCGGRDPVDLLYAGRLSPEKNVRILPGVVAALADYPRQIHLVIAGGGPYRPRLESEAAAVAPGRVYVLGHLDREPLWRLLHACDIFIHPNPREPFGLGPLEAMAANIPVVAPDSGGLRTYASEENAWLGPAIRSAWRGWSNDVSRMPPLGSDVLRREDRLLKLTSGPPLRRASSRTTTWPVRVLSTEARVTRCRVDMRQLLVISSISIRSLRTA